MIGESEGQGTEHPQSELSEGIALIDPRTGQVLRRFHQDHWRLVEIAGVLEGELVFSICANNYRTCRGLVRGFGVEGRDPATCALGRLHLESGVVREEPLERCLGQRPKLIGGHVLSNAAAIQALELETRTVLEVSRLRRYVNLHIGPDGSAYFTRTRQLDQSVRLEIGAYESSNVPGIYRLDLSALQQPH